LPPSNRRAAITEGATNTPRAEILSTGRRLKGLKIDEKKKGLEGKGNTATTEVEIPREEKAIKKKMVRRSQTPGGVRTGLKGGKEKSVGKRENG